MNKRLQYILQVLTPAEKKIFWLQIIFSIIINVADIGALAFLLLVTDFYINNNVDRLQFLPGWVLDPGSVILITFFLVFFGIKNLIGIAVTNGQYNFIRKVATRISSNKLTAYQYGEFENYVKIDSSAHISRIAYYPFEFCQHVLAGVQQVIIQSVLILLTVSAIILYNANLFLLLLAILLPPVALVFFFIRRKLAKTKREILATNELSHQYLYDALKGFVEGNIYQRNEFFHDRFIGSRSEFSKNLFNSLSVQQMPSRLIEVFAVLGLFILIVIAKWSGVNDSSTLIMIGAFMAAAYKIIPGIVKIINAVGQMKTYELSIPREDSADQNKGVHVSGTSIDSIEMRDISFLYDTHQVLSGFSISVKKGDFIGITGQSGKGKTTILNLLLGFLTPSTGEIKVNGMAVTSKNLKSYWSQIAYVRQQPFFIYDSIARNITLENGSIEKERLEMALDISGLKSFIDQSPEGLDRMITENGKNISGGQQQRISIARALYKNAHLLLLDEPFNELDETSTKRIVEHLASMSRLGYTIVIITHDSRCLSFCDKIISLDDR